MKVVSALIFILATSVWAFAGDAAGPVGTIWASPTSSFVMFNVASTSTEYHRCNESQRYSIDLRKPGGDATYALLMLAKQENYRIQVESLNTCNPFDAENIRNLLIT